MLRRGIAVSPGVAIGTAYCVDEVLARLEPGELNRAQAARELARLDRAWTAAIDELRALQHKVAAQVGDKEAAIFHAHEMILHDPTLVTSVKESITSKHLPARAALHELLNEYTSRFARFKDEYWRERLADVRDVITRVSTHLAAIGNSDAAAAKGPVILVAQEVLPSQAAALGRLQVAGIVTETGAATSHAAILARSRGIPAVSGVHGIAHDVKTGDVVVVDGREGHVLINPGPEVEAAYRKLQREFVHLKDQLVENRDQPAISADGQAVELFANINSVADARTAAAMGASGVGLFRTEYIFLTHPDVPDEEEQLAAYRQVIEASPNRRVTIRTLDLGGDKTVPYLGHHGHRDANPFMGWRSIRLSFEHPEFFQTQIRAILRAGRYGKVRIKFPMITTLEELRRVRRMVERAKKDLERRKLPHGKDVKLGLMLEVPAAALAIRNLLNEVDFVSIGSNDLVQYLMAADRDNPKVAHLCQPLSPAVLELLRSVIQSCDEAKVPVTLCGEMAARPREFLLLFGMGLRQFSMSPAFIPWIKELLLHVTVAQTEELLQRVLRMKTAGQIQAYLRRQVQKLAPNLDWLDSA